MGQKILVIQFREDVTREHEQSCISRVMSHDDVVEFWDIFDLSKDFSNPSFILNYDKLILGGSAGISMGPDHDNNDYSKVEIILTRIKPLISYVLDHDFPTFGTCFGHQLLGYFLETDVVHDSEQAETGFAQMCLTENGRKDIIFEGVEDRFYAVVGHQDSLESTPQGAILLAYSDKCRVHAFKYKQNIYATQFHGELNDEDLVYRLNLFPVYKNYLLELQIEDSSQAALTLQNFIKKVG